MMVTKLQRVEKGMAELAERIAEQEAKRRQAETDLAELEAEWRALCLRADVDGEDVGADIASNEAQQAVQRRAIDRVDVVLPELNMRFEAALAERDGILYQDRKAALAKLDAKDTPLLRKYLKAARQLLAVAEEVHEHEGAKQAIVQEVSQIAQREHFQALSVRRLPIFDVSPDEAGPASDTRSLEHFITHKLAPRWPDAID